MSVTEDDPVDMIRYLIDTNWDLTLYKPKPVIEAMTKQRSSRAHANLVRPYGIGGDVEPVSLGADFESETHQITVDIESISEDQLELLYQGTRAALVAARNNPNIAGSNKYEELLIKEYKDLSIEKKNIYHCVIETELFVDDEYVG